MTGPVSRGRELLWRAKDLVLNPNSVDWSVEDDRAEGELR